MIWVAVWRRDGRAVTTVEARSFEVAQRSYPRNRLQRLRVCTACAHPECPMCQTWCDQMVGKSLEACCDGACTYDRPRPYRVAAPPAPGTFMTPAQRRGLVFSLHANGATFNKIGEALGISGSRARQLDALTRQQIERAADRRFPLPEPWRGVGV